MITNDQIKALADALDLLHDFISQNGAKAEDYTILDEADRVFKEIAK